MWERVQLERPASLTNVSRLAPPNEPGQPLVVEGEVRLPDRQAAAGVVVFAYQTDDGGLYARPGSATPWRLKGWAATDAAGRFEFDTIRPGPYPNHSTPAHIHLSFVTACCGRQFDDLMFDDDPLATPAFRAHFAQVGEHALYVSVHNVQGVQHARVTVPLRPRGDF